MNRLPEEPKESVEELLIRRLFEIDLPEHMWEMMEIRFREVHGYDPEHAGVLMFWAVMQGLFSEKVASLMKDALTRPPEEIQKIFDYLDRNIQEAAARGCSPVPFAREVTNDTLLREAKKIEEN